MQTVLSVSLPFFGLIFAGYAAGQFRALSAPAIVGINHFVFWFALPALLFMKMSQAPVLAAFDWRFVVAWTAAGATAYAACLLLGRALFGSPLAHGAIQGMGAAFGNVGYMGLPLVIALFGDRAVLPAVLIIVFDHLLNLPLTIALIEGGSGKHASLPAIFRRVGVGLAKNPLMLATAAGIAWGATGLALPLPLAAFGDLLGNAAAPCALFALGATLAGRRLTEGLGEVGLISACKLLLHPAAAFAFAALLGLEDWLVALAAIEASLPVAANVFVMAQAYGLYAARASAAILLSTVLAVVTVSAALALLAP